MPCMMDDGSGRQNHLIGIVGPTATGKTDVGVLVAQAIGGEIISADSMQIWRGMDIGTAKPDRMQMQRAPIHLVDVADPHESFSAAEFQALAWRARDEILSRNRSVILVGGTGLYVRAVVEGYQFPPQTPPEVRRQLQQEAEENGPPEMLRRLAEVDPETARRLTPENLRRILRALEVYKATGRPLSAWLQRGTSDQPQWRLFGLKMERETLNQRINARVDQMICNGLVEEVRRLHGQGLTRRLQAGRALGYQEVIAHLEGECSLQEAVEAIKQNTRRYAKRQRTWFRRERSVHWIDVTHQDAGHAAQEIVAELRAATG